MKAKLIGKITNMAPGNGDVAIQLDCTGDVVDVPPPAKPITMKVSLSLKQIVGMNIKLGDTFTIMLTNDQ